MPSLEEVCARVLRVQLVNRASNCQSILAKDETNKKYSRASVVEGVDSHDWQQQRKQIAAQARNAHAEAETVRLVRAGDRVTIEQIPARGRGGMCTVLAAQHGRIKGCHSSFDSQNARRASRQNQKRRSIMFESSLRAEQRGRISLTPNSRLLNVVDVQIQTFIDGHSSISRTQHGIWRLLFPTSSHDRYRGVVNVRSCCSKRISRQESRRNCWASSRIPRRESAGGQQQNFTFVTRENEQLIYCTLQIVGNFDRRK